MNTIEQPLDAGFFRGAIESSMNCIRILDLQGLLLFANRSALTALEVDGPVAFDGAAWSSYWPEPGRGQIARGIEAARRGETYRFDGQCPTRRGTAKWWDVVIAPITDLDGRVVAISAITRDITAARLARATAADTAVGLARIATAMGSAFRVAQVGAWELNFLTGRVLFSSELFTLLGRRPRPEMSIAQANLMWSDEDRPAFERSLEHVQQFGERLIFEGRTLNRKGAIKWWRVFGEPEIVDGRCVALHGAAQDVTEWRQALERERSALRAADEMSGFLATMSHEIRTPLNGVLGMVQVMGRGELSPLQRERLGVIETSGEALLSLLNDLLDLSKIEAGKIELEDGVVDVQDLADGARAMFAALVQEKDVILALTVAPSARGFWTGDSKRIGQVAHNLISNALKFTEHGSVQVEFSHVDGRLILRVSDTGIGIPAESLACIFDRFVQADASTTRRYGGSGLGLAICRDLVALMRGDIAVESTVGVGTVFTVTLPLARAEAPERPQPAPQPSSEPALGHAPLRVLAAEDNATNQLVLKVLLGQVGIEPFIVANGQEAVDAWRDGPWDVVLMDIQMPVMDGITAVKTIRAAEIERGCGRTPIIALTANAMSHHLDNYLNAGMDALVPKPVNFAHLLETMRGLVDRNPEAGADEHLQKRAV